jgi:hypothetical protein
MGIDYYPLVSKAASALRSDTADARHLLFERIRVILVNQLRSRQPPASRFEITRERAGLESAIQRVELELKIRFKNLDSHKDTSRVEHYGQRLRAFFAEAQVTVGNQMRSLRLPLACIFETPRAAIENALSFLIVFRGRAVLAQGFGALRNRSAGENYLYLQDNSTVFGQVHANEFVERAPSTILRNLVGIQLLDRLMLDAAQPRAPDNVRQDGRTVLNWLGIEKAEPLGPEHYDQFSCAVHKYILECQEQSLRLAPTTAHSPSALNDEIRSVLNRLLEREQTERIIDEALTWFSTLWIGLFVVLTIIVIIGVFVAAPTLRSAVAKLADIYNPLNMPTWISQILALTPALLSMAWRHRRLKRSSKAPKMVFGTSVTIAARGASDLAAPLVA